MFTRVSVAVAALAALIAACAPGSALARPIVLDESDAITTPAGDRSTATTVWFQGFLADDATGDPVNATYNIVASIYSLAAGGVLLWGPETHVSVTITEGWFNIELGSITSPLPSFAAPPYYLSLQVNGETLTPRLKLASVPSAIQSATSDLLPFDGVYSGSSNAIELVHNGSNGADAINVTRTSSTSGAYAIYATSSAPTAVMRGYQTNGTTVTTAPVLDLDISNSANGSRVIDASTNGTGPTYYGRSDGLYAVDVATGAQDAPDGDVHVIHAVYDGADRSGANVAVYGEALDDAWGLGGDFVGSGVGVWGTASPPPSGNFFYYGVYGEAIAASVGMNVGVCGSASGGNTNYAGLFGGDVDVGGTLTKDAGSFKIDHPLDPANKYLSHSFVESPDMMNIYNGNAELDAAGEAWVELPDWFEALNRDFRYQLTPIGAPAPGLYVADEIAGNRFRIAGGEAGTRVSWLVTGIRHDPYADAHRIPVEEVKSAREQGRYRNPELYGLPESSGVFYDERLAKAHERRTARAHREATPEAPEGVDPANQ